MAVVNMQDPLPGVAHNATTKVKRKGDHKRVARPIAPAAVTVRDGEIVVVVPDVLGKNESCRGGRVNAVSKGARYLSAATKAFRWSIVAGIVAWEREEIEEARRQIRIAEIERSRAMKGPWRAEVLGVWPNERHTIEGRPMDFPAPMGDADAPVAQAFDALKHGGILDDDARIVLVTAANLYRKGERWTVIRLVRVPDLAERDAAIAHLVAALPPPAVPAEPKPRTKAARRKRKETA